MEEIARMSNDVSLKSLEHFDESKYPQGEGWSNEVEIYLNNISQKCIIFRNIHEESAIYYEKNFHYFSLVLIFFSFVSSVITVLPINHNLYNYITSITTILTATLATTNKFLKWQEYITKHKFGSQNFLSLNENITSQMLTNVHDRSHAIQYVRWAGKMFINIRKSLPFPPDSIIVKLNVNDDPDISLSDILDENGKISSRIIGGNGNSGGDIKSDNGHGNGDSKNFKTYNQSDVENLPVTFNNQELTRYQHYQLSRFKQQLQQFQT